MTENNIDLSEIMIYKDFHKERRYLVYYLLIYITIYLTYTIFLKEGYHSQLNNKFLIRLPFSQFNDLLNNIGENFTTLKDNIIFDSGEVNIPLLTSAIIFLLIGFKAPNNLTLIIIFNIIFQILLIFFNKSGNLLTYSLFNIVGYKFGSSFYDFFFGDKYLNTTTNMMELNN